jgi:diacylglycerol kinase
MGALSNFGVIMLFSSASIALFSATLASDRAGRSFLIYAGLFSSLLATDDLFGLHDRVFFELFVGELAPGEIERNVKLAYLAAQVVYLVAFYKVIRRLNYLLLAGSLLLFFISNALDTRFVAVLVAILGSPLSESAQQAWEDLPKLAGTVFWLWFHMLAARKIVSEGWSQRLLPPGQQGRSG